MTVVNHIRYAGNPLVVEDRDVTFRVHIDRSLVAKDESFRMFDLNQVAAH